MLHKGGVDRPWMLTLSGWVRSDTVLGESRMASNEHLGIIKWTKSSAYSYAIFLFASTSCAILFFGLCICCFCLGVIELGFVGSCFSTGRRNSWHFLCQVWRSISTYLEKDMTDVDQSWIRTIGFYLFQLKLYSLICFHGQNMGLFFVIFPKKLHCFWRCIEKGRGSRLKCPSAIIFSLTTKIPLQNQEPP